MIRLDNLSFQYGEQKNQPQIKNINLHVKKGEFILLTGKSGCGKTTLTRVLNGLCPQFFPGTLTGSYRLEGRNAAEIPIAELGTLVGSVFQDPRSQFFATNTTDEIALGLEHHGLTREEIRLRLLKTAAQIGVENLLDRSLFSLPSGEKQRIAIASVCALKSGILVLDEPTANLDSDGILQLSALLERLKASGITIILSEHRLHYVRNSFDRMVVMSYGEISRCYTRQDALALPQSEMAEMGLRLFDEPFFQAGKSVKKPDTPAVAAHQISLTFSGQSVLNDVSIETDQSRITAVTGGNGAGKSSLCRVLAGLYKPQTGLVFLHGELMKRKKRIRNTFFVQQDTDYQLYGASVREEFLIGTSAGKLSDEAIGEYLRAVGLDDISDRHPLSLSGGQKQRLLLALSLASGKDILVLDEPTSGLDGANMRLFAKLFLEQAQAGRTFILITHDKEFIRLCADSVLHLDKGKVLYHRIIQRD